MARLGYRPLHMGRFPQPTLHPSRSPLPVLLSIPHAGQNYDSETLANAAQGRISLETLEDPLVDRLAWRAIAGGIGAVVQNVPRAIIDCNRDEEEVDPAAISGISPAPVGPRARFGLGLVPSRTYRHGGLWRKPIDRAELHRRIMEVHRPYHQAISTSLDELAIRCGEALLLDCHSMPHRRGQADVVIGDRNGGSAASWIGAEAAQHIRNAGFTVAMNDPYAGGAIVERHGNPGKGVHALQIEIDRSTYLTQDGRSAGLAFDRVASLIDGLANHLGRAIADRAFREAAE